MYNYIYVNDFEKGLAYHDKMTSENSFREIGPFLPDIKVLIETLIQLRDRAV